MWIKTICFEYVSLKILTTESMLDDANIPKMFVSKMFQ